MKKILLTPVATLLFGLAFSMPSSAQIHSHGAGMMGGGCPMMEMMGGGMMDRGMMGDRQAHMGGIAEGRLAFLKSELAITDKQTEAWNGYAKAVKAGVATMQEMHAGMMGAVEKGTAIERMDARIKGMQGMVEAISALKPATAMLYDALTPEQKKVADELIGVGCGGM
jgi:hypothetical protein